MTGVPTEVSLRIVLPDGQEVTAGTIVDEGVHGRLAGVMAFRYSESYLADPRAYPLSPDMPLSSGPHRAWPGRPALGAVGDALPDQWGRRIIRARFPVRGSFDYLVHVADLTRQGALRVEADGSYLAAESHPAAQILDLAAIIAASRAFEEGRETEDDLRILVAAGTSGGGARPKAAVRGADGALWMAKFARETEFYDPMAWEAAALDLARTAGITVPQFDLVTLRDDQSVLLTRRFDRAGDARRIGYLSAHSLVMKTDDEALSYAHLSDALAATSPDPRGDQAELFRRAAFNVLIGNVDDHFRNHGFLRMPTGWALSPAFDLEPNGNPERVEATPLVDGGDRLDRDIRELVGAHDAFRLSGSAAASIVRDVAERTSAWVDVAMSYGISPESTATRARVFDGPNRKRALAFSAS